MNRPNNQSGIGLSEVLISLFLASLIMTTLIQLYLSNKRQYVEAQKLLGAGLDLQWISDLLSDSIRRAGFTPCLGIEQLTTMDRRNFKSTIPGLIIEQTPEQLIQINRMSESFTRVIAIQSPTQLIISNGNLFKELRPVLIADCEHAEIHQILRVEKLERNYLVILTKPLMFSYTPFVYLGEWFEEKWFIKEKDKKKTALYYKLFHTEELSTLIRSLAIKRMRVNGKLLITIVMGLDNHKTQQLVVAVRGS
ncbi:PilW family protein [Legionella maioricensis]|uniref:Prepilin cleavage protein n=1 Tax=Legionella maioricensis TaxID=2896528 RepID=A0A9X2CYN8_9GAMM|nr:prepilin cleavage protein [Legionella maioricensis]MCL9682722.1 prepilin cleavage protein [Legionella maioricensis]MCL9687230.1 prepilin cleavage protein [Legionella maioricensis]